MMSLMSMMMSLMSMMMSLTSMMMSLAMVKINSELLIPSFLAVHRSDNIFEGESSFMNIGAAEEL